MAAALTRAPACRRRSASLVQYRQALAAIQAYVRENYTLFRAPAGRLYYAPAPNPPMILTLEASSATGRELPAPRSMVFHARGGTIGRTVGNDWVLPDPYVSS